MEDIISNAQKMAKNLKSNMYSLHNKMKERFANSENKNKKIFGYLLIMLIIIIVLIMSYCNNTTDLSSTSSGVFQKPEHRGFFK